MGNTWGSIFKITTWGESHGPASGVVIDGCPAGFEVDLDNIQNMLNRRRPGQSALTSERKERDRLKVLSGIKDGLTLGSPISFLSANEDAQSKDYDPILSTYRPSHADYTYHQKYGMPQSAGSGRASARETWGRVAAGALALQILESQGVQLRAFVERIQDITAPWSLKDPLPSLDVIESSPVRTLDPTIAEKMAERIQTAKSGGDSLGGAIVCRIFGVSAGVGCPVFDKLEADLAKAMLSIPAVKAFEIGSGFAGTYQTGSQHNDPMTLINGLPAFTQNNSGGIQGGISNGEEIYMRIGFKPTSTIQKPQTSLNTDCEPITIEARGRHDPCVLPRATPIVEAMAALTLLDHTMRACALTPLTDFAHA